MKIDVDLIKESRVLVNYRTVRKWACKKYGVSAQELEILISLYHDDTFGYGEFNKFAYTSKWDAGRLQRFIENGFVNQYRKEIPRRGIRRLYKVSRKTKNMVETIIKILLGQKKIPMDESNPYYKGETYTDKIMLTQINTLNKEQNGKY